MDNVARIPAKKERLADTVYGRILGEITSGIYAPGDKLPSEAEFSFSFAVSRPVVREALLRLTTDGLIQSKRGVGTFVSSQPSNRLTELVDTTEISLYLRSFEPRIVLEVEAARLAAQRRSRADITRAHDAIEALREAITAGELGQVEDLEFHNAITEASGNEYFVQLLNDLRQPVSKTMNIGLELARERSAGRRMRILEEHTRVLDAIVAEDSDAAASYMKYHLMQARAAVLDAQHLENSQALGNTQR
jgi:GntR family transcriptional repressor for pyruvate dehydrogenase complex